MVPGPIVQRSHVNSLNGERELCNSILMGNTEAKHDGRTDVLLTALYNSDSS